ncbi:MAG: hypothetical protein NVS3B20_23980 [Polyangiales bacterium]
MGELVGSIRDYEDAARAEGATPSITSFLERTALVTMGDDHRAKDRANEGVASDPNDVITLMTVHAAKGLEYRGVLITGMEDELFPYKCFRSVGDEEGSGSIGLSAEEEDLEEERRLAYVAITRAKEELTLFYAAQRTLFGQTRYNRASRFLRDLPASDVRQVSSSRRAAPIRNGGGNAPAPTSNGPRAPFRHPMSSSPMRTSSKPPPTQYAEGERFVELDEGAQIGDDVRRGGVVRHKRFGDGKVIDVVEGAESKVVAAFPGWGTMTVLRRFLEVVSE